MHISVQMTGDKEVMAKLKRLGPELHDLKTPMEEIGGALATYYSGKAFPSKGGVFGNVWEQLSPATRKYKMKNYRAYTNTPLMRTGTMSNSFMYTATREGVTIGNSAPYFKYHQSSLPRSSNLPRRQMMGINSAVRKIVVDALQKDIRAKLAKA